MVIFITIFLRFLLRFVLCSLQVVQYGLFQQFIIQSSCLKDVSHLVLMIRLDWYKMIFKVPDSKFCSKILSQRFNYHLFNLIGEMQITKFPLFSDS